LRSTVSGGAHFELRLVTGVAERVSYLLHGVSNRLVGWSTKTHAEAAQLHHITRSHVGQADDAARAGQKLVSTFTQLTNGEIFRFLNAGNRLIDNDVFTFGETIFSGFWTIGAGAFSFG